MKRIQVKVNKPYVQQDLFGNKREIKPAADCTVILPAPAWLPEPAPCPTCGSDDVHFYFPKGWHCHKCGRWWFTNREFDRTRIFDKVVEIVDELYNEGLIYISNGSEGEAIFWSVTEWCVKNHKYSTDCIMEATFEICNRRFKHIRGKQA